MRKKLFIAIAVLMSGTAQSQLVIDNTTYTPEQLVQNFLVGPGVTVSNVKFNGVLGAPVNAASGYFTSTGTTPVGFPSGIILGSGNVQGALGPNNTGSFSLGGTGWGVGDPDLALMTGSSFNDAAVLEFDFIPNGDSINFRYCFASEEYPEFVFSSFNDAFGFFLSGPGISGPYLGGVGANIAIVPGSSTAVSINTINHGMYTCPGPMSPVCTNCAYYVDNCNPSASVIQYDGYTTALIARAQVQCGQTYHIKLAIADAGDTGYDSGIFLEEGSFASNGVDVTIATPTSAGFVNGAVYENCILGTSATFHLVRPVTTSADTVPFLFTGSAILGSDYTATSTDTFVVFAVGQDSASFGVTILNDGITEPMDSLVVTVFNINPCGDTIISTGTLYIHDPLVVVPDIVNDTIPCTGLPVSFIANTTGTPLDIVYSWTGPGGIPDTDSAVMYVPPSGGLVTVTATDECGFTGSDNAEIVIVPVPVVANGGPDQTVPCAGQVVNMSGSGSSGTLPYTYNWSGPGLSSTATSVTYNVSMTTPVYFTVTDFCGQTYTDTVQVSIVPVPVIANAGPDQSVSCPGQIVNLNGSASSGTGSYDYLWIYSGGTIATTPSTTHTVNNTHMVFLSVTDECGQVGIDTVLVTAPTIQPFVLNYDSTVSVLCPGAPANLSVTVVSGGVGAPYTYAWDNFDTDNNATYPVMVSPSTAQVTITDACGVNITIHYVMTIDTFPVLVVTPGEGEICQREDQTLAIPVSITGGAGGYSVNWVSPVGSVAVHDMANGETMVANPVSGLYIVTLVDQCGNIDIDSANIIVLNCDLIIPNIITCNGDGINDGFVIKNLERHPNTSVSIFNRWGQLKYENSSYQNDYKPSDLTDGVYYYIVKLSDGTSPAEYTGTVQIVNKN